MIIKPMIIYKGSKVYRFINVAPSIVKLGMTQNKGKNGRCNKHQNIYYCSKSLDALLQELDYSKDIMGSLIVSDVIEDIQCGLVFDTISMAKFRGRTENEPSEMIHNMVLRPIGLDIQINYAETNKITLEVLGKYPDGIIYPSVHSIDCILGSTIFQADEDTGFGNIALTDSGFKKIKEREPLVYWHNDIRR